MNNKERQQLGIKIQRFNYLFNETYELHKLIVKGNDFLSQNRRFDKELECELYSNKHFTILENQILFHSHYNIVNLQKLLSISKGDKNSLTKIDNSMIQLEKCEESIEIRFLIENIYTNFNELISNISILRDKFFGHLDNKTFKEINEHKSFYLENLDEISKLMDSISELLVKLIIYYFDEFKENDPSKKIEIDNHILRISTEKDGEKSYLNSNSKINLHKMIDLYKDLLNIQEIISSNFETDENKINKIKNLLIEHEGNFQGQKITKYKY